MSMSRKVNKGAFPLLLKRWRYIMEDPIVNFKDVVSLLTKEQLADKITEVSLYSSLTIGKTYIDFDSTVIVLC